MIKFFRKIRYNLMETGKTGKYFKYAIGEIILVVIGILIALQINNWNEKRKENIQEQVILKQLRENFLANASQLQQRIAIRNNVISNATELLKYFGRGDDIEEDSVLVKFARTVNVTSFDPVENDLVSSGNLKIIKSQKLKQLLTNWSTNVIQLQEIEQVFFRFYENHIITFIKESGIGRDGAFLYWQDNKHIISLLSTDNLYNPIVGRSIIGNSIKDQLNNPEFEGIVSQTITLNVFNNLESATLNGNIEDILKHIELEIME